MVRHQGNFQDPVLTLPRIAVHATQEWYDLYSKERADDLQRFFDHYMKGVENGWEQTPPVRLAVLGFNKPPTLDLPFNHLPWLNPTSQSTKLQRLYLAHDMTLKEVNAAEYTTLGYQDDENLVFSHVFSRPTTLVGPTKLVVSISCPSETDFDVYAQLRKRDKNGNDLEHINIPLEDLGVADPEEIPNVNPLKYLGPSGRLRASKRRVAPELSQRCWQTLAHDGHEPPTPGEIVKLEVWIWPTAIRFDPGEQLVVKLAGADNMSLPEFEFLKEEPKKAPAQILHLGGEFESYLEASWYH